MPCSSIVHHLIHLRIEWIMLCFALLILLPTFSINQTYISLLLSMLRYFFYSIFYLLLEPGHHSGLQCSWLSNRWWIGVIDAARKSSNGFFGFFLWSIHNRFSVAGSLSLLILHRILGLGTSRSRGEWGHELGGRDWIRKPTLWCVMERIHGLLFCAAVVSWPFRQWIL